MKKEKLKLLWELYITFCQVGLFTFGGGLAMLPMLTKQVVEKKKWSTEEDILNYYAIGQCTPGLIAVNTSTFIGYKKAGILGGFIATFGFISPSIVIILLISNVLNMILGAEIVNNAFAGIRVAVCALICSIVLKLIKSNIDSVVKIAMAIVGFIAITFFNISPIIITLVAIVIGIILWKGEFENE